MELNIIIMDVYLLMKYVVKRGKKLDLKHFLLCVRPLEYGNRIKACTESLFQMIRYNNNNNNNIKNRKIIWNDFFFIHLKSLT